ncbi:hypothetical protein B0H16DRAFT_1691885 [Mycena metata]|uniref:Uncharacterized protein n=1 Tax=Mycena metata TaxID=1033252 RepID=A0AAD7ISA8_9AGAR|nr:hypothetical protein B0H16DRAFT_1691885 [Mycena metata]
MPCSRPRCNYGRSLAGFHRPGTEASSSNIDLDVHIPGFLNYNGMSVGGAYVDMLSHPTQRHCLRLYATSTGWPFPYTCALSMYPPTLQTHVSVHAPSTLFRREKKANSVVRFSNVCIYLRLSPALSFASPVSKNNPYQIIITWQNGQDDAPAASNAQTRFRLRAQEKGRLTAVNESQIDPELTDWCLRWAELGGKADVEVDF